MSYTISKNTKLPASEIEIEAEIPWADAEVFHDESVKDLNESVEVPGFRKGKVPADVLKKRFGENSITEDMAERAVSKAISDIILNEKLNILTRPNVQITQLAPNNPVKFKIKAVLIPEVTLPDYKKIAKEINSKRQAPAPVTEKDVDEMLLKVRTNMSVQKAQTEKTDVKEASKPENLPPLDENLAKTLGSESVEKLKETVKINIEAERRQEEYEKHRIKLSEKIIEGTKTETPEVLIESELNRIEAQFKDNVTRFGLKFEDYLTHAKKTLEDVRKEWRPDAEKRAKLQLVLNKIAEIEKIQPDPQQVEIEAKHLTEHYKDADPERAKIYVETVLINEAVYQMLEGIK